jgi:hypothetical protein
MAGRAGFSNQNDTQPDIPLKQTRRRTIIPGHFCIEYLMEHGVYIFRGCQKLHVRVFINHKCFNPIRRTSFTGE